VRRLAGGRLNRLTHALRRQRLVVLTAIRLVPLGPFAVQNLVAGAVRVSFWRFLAATFLGMLPGTLVTTVFGEQLRGALLGRGLDLPLLLPAVLAVAAAALVVRRALRRLEAPEPA
jgi:uncharacterized membrane protein YdjX (TVP38/TMEM64 family)